MSKVKVRIPVLTYLDGRTPRWTSMGVFDHMVKNAKERAVTERCAKDDLVADLPRGTNYRITWVEAMVPLPEGPSTTDGFVGRQTANPGRGVELGGHKVLS